MRFGTAALGLGALLAAGLASAPAARAHATYNLSGYDAGIAGSTNGADGSPTAVPPATWSNGPGEDYAGALPANWYAGMHSTTQTRTIQTGVAPNPPAGSQLAQVTTYNASNDPDLPVDRVLAVGGKSWTDPDNANQGWGHGLDYGLIHYAPVDEILADGPIAVTVTLADDPTDAVAVQLAFALYGGWDTTTTATRHQTFTTDPAPVDDPLGSNIELVDYAVATSAGQTISRTFLLDDAYGGHYTILIGALGGVAGQYQLTIATAPVDLTCEPDPTGALAECQADLSAMTSNYAAAVADADGDGKRDQDDACAGTPAGAPVDPAGCSQSQFCASADVSTRKGRKLCAKMDWQNDEPVIKKKTRDCSYVKAASACQPVL